MDAILRFDSSILLWIQDHLRGGILTPIMQVITHLGDKGAFWILLTLALLIYPNRRGRRLGVFCGVAMVFGLIVTNVIIKNWVARVRPYDIDNPLFQRLILIVGAEHDYSFPSGHTTNSLACAWVLFKKAPRKWGVSALVLAILISLSRLYVGIHYPTDVLGGVVIGIGSACLSIWLVPKLEKRFPIIKKFYGPKKRRKKTAASKSAGTAAGK